MQMRRLIVCLGWTSMPFISFFCGSDLYVLSFAKNSSIFEVNVSIWYFPKESITFQLLYSRIVEIEEQ